MTGVQTCALPIWNALVNQHRNDQQEHADDDEIENSARRAACRPYLSRIEVFGANDSLRRKLVEPGETHRDGKTKRERNDDKANRRIWNVEERKNLCRELSEEPGDDSVSDRRAVDIAPLQLGEEIPWIHGDYLPGPINSEPVSSC